MGSPSLILDLGKAAELLRRLSKLQEVNVANTASSLGFDTTTHGELPERTPRFAIKEMG